MSEVNNVTVNGQTVTLSAADYESYQKADDAGKKAILSNQLAGAGKKEKHYSDLQILTVEGSGKQYVISKSQFEEFNKADRATQDAMIENFTEFDANNPPKIEAKKTNEFGNRAFGKKDDSRISFSMISTIEPLVDSDGNSIIEAQEKRYEVIKNRFAEQNRGVSTVQILEEATETTFAPLVDKLHENVKKSNTDAGKVANKMAYFHHVMTEEEKDQVASDEKKLNAENSYLMGIPQGKKQPEALTEANKKKLEALKQEYNKRFPDDPLRDNETFDLRGVTESSVVADRVDKMNVLNHVLAIENGIAARNKGNASGGELSDGQLREIAKAQVKEQITHQDQIAQLENQLKVGGANVEKIGKKIDTLKKDFAGKMKDLNEVRVANYTQAQLEYEVAKQNFDNTVVHWNKKDAKAAEKDPKTQTLNNTFVDDYAKDVIKRNPSVYCAEVDQGEADFQGADGKFYKFDSNSYKREMLRLSNSQQSNTDAKLDGDYYASTSEFVDFAEANHDARAKNKKDAAKPATMKERKAARNMYQTAGLQVAGDLTYQKRGEAIGKAALIGAGVGAGSALLGEVYKAASAVKYSGVANAVLHETIPYSENKDYSGEVTLPYSDTVTTNFESITQVYDRVSGTYITTGHQITPHTQEVSGTVTGHYSGSITVEGSVQYDNEHIPAPYQGKARYSVDPVNIAKGAVNGAVMGAGIRGLKYLFGKKTPDDYSNNETVKDKYRTDMGYQGLTHEKNAELGQVYVDKTPEVKVVDTEISSETPVREVPIIKFGGYWQNANLYNDNNGKRINGDDLKQLTAYLKEHGIERKDKHHILEQSITLPNGHVVNLADEQTVVKRVKELEGNDGGVNMKARSGGYGVSVKKGEGWVAVHDPSKTVYKTKEEAESADSKLAPYRKK